MRRRCVLFGYLKAYRIKHLLGGAEFKTEVEAPRTELQVAAPTSSCHQICDAMLYYLIGGIQALWLRTTRSLRPKRCRAVMKSEKLTSKSVSIRL